MESSFSNNSWNHWLLCLLLVSCYSKARNGLRKTWASNQGRVVFEMTKSLANEEMSRLVDLDFILDEMNNPDDLQGRLSCSFEITNYLDDEKDNDMYTGNDDVSIIVIEWIIEESPKTTIGFISTWYPSRWHCWTIDFKKKKRFCWDESLHFRFLEFIFRFGIDSICSTVYLISRY